MTLDTSAFTKWLQQYGAAWESRDPRAAAELFTPDAEYYWTPFDAPQRGRREIAGAWEGAVSKQSDVRFSFDVFAVAGTTGMASWSASFSVTPEGGRVELKGVLRAEFASPGQCRVFREWWHMKAGA